MNPYHFTLKKILIATAITLICSGCGKQSTPPAKEAAARPAEALTLVDFSIAKNESGKSVLKGSVSNSSNQAIAQASARFKLLDKSGTEVGTAVAGVEHLQARFSWNFTVEITPENTASAEFLGFTIQ